MNGGGSARADQAADAHHAWLALGSGTTLLAIFWVSLTEGLYNSSSTAVHLLSGTALMSAGIILRGLAIRTLGEQFRTQIVVKPGAQLVQRGIYRHLRHPSETGLLLVAAGAAILFASWWGLLLTLGALVPLIHLRLAWEEAELDAAWGPRFAAYRRLVPALLPRIL